MNRNLQHKIIKTKWNTWIKLEYKQIKLLEISGSLSGPLNTTDDIEIRLWNKSQSGKLCDVLHNYKMVNLDRCWTLLHFVVRISLTVLGYVNRTRFRLIRCRCSSVFPERLLDCSTLRELNLELKTQPGICLKITT